MTTTDATTDNPSESNPGESTPESSPLPNLPESTLLKLFDYIKKSLGKRAYYYAIQTRMFTSGGLTDHDLLQEAYLEAMRAAERWEADQGMNFRVFCANRANMAMIDAIRRYSETYNRIKKRRIALIGRISTRGNRIGVRGDWEDKLDKFEPAEKPQPEPDLDDIPERFEKVARKIIRKILNDRDYQLLTLRYAKSYTAKQIGEAFGICESAAAREIVRVEGEVRKHVYDQGWAEGEVSELLLIDRRG